VLRFLLIGVSLLVTMFFSYLKMCF